MPQDLPGFYFDVTRNRYFPLNSRPATGTSDSVSDQNQAVALSSSAASTSTQTKNIIKASSHPGSARPVRTSTKGECTAAARRRLAGKLSLSDIHDDLYSLQHSNLAHRARFVSSTHAPFDHYGVDLTSIFVSDLSRIPKDMAMEEDTTHDQPRSRPGLIFAGDKAGMLYATSKEDPYDPWVPVHHLGSQISSVYIHNKTMYAASLGPKPQIFISTSEFMSSLSMHSFHDMWTVHWLMPSPESDASNASAVIGMKQRAVYMPSLETHRGAYIMPTNSDVFSVYKHHWTVLTGARNGSVKLFDVRTPPTSHVNIFPPCVRASRTLGVPVADPIPRRGLNLAPTSRGTAGSRWNALSKSPTRRPLALGNPAHDDRSAGGTTLEEAKPMHTSSVTNLRVLDEWGLLLASMDGTLNAYDMRFCGFASRSQAEMGTFVIRSTKAKLGEVATLPRPVFNLAGHVNTCSQGLGFCVNPSASILLAAGEDKRIRAWSLRTGDNVTNTSTSNSPGPSGKATPNLSSSPRSTPQAGLLSRTFSRPVNSIVMAEDGKEIWVASGREALCFEGTLSFR